MKLRKNDVLMCTTCEKFPKVAGHLAVVLGPADPIGNQHFVTISYFETHEDGQGPWLQVIPANGSDAVFVKVGVL